ncbi:DUF3806 domain-containing protein [Atopomonas hussainii]|uniref:DUF3806 domain-containing protein n=1 Tax=Atopomonas hussainii TaxID=1429083 RepID=UPI00094237B3|nr:DUF3806 domain-containing protein [Atopomonas hussainii]
MTSYGGTKTDDPNEVVIKTPTGEVVAEHRTEEPFQQDISPVKANVISEISALAREASNFQQKYLPVVTILSLETLDQAVMHWRNDDVSDYSEREVIAILGAYLGERLAADFGLKWVIVSDKYGTDYAVTDNERGTQVFPFSSVAKRIDLTEARIMVGIYYTAKHGIENSRANRN